MNDEQYAAMKEAADRASMNMEAMSGISRAKPGSVRRLVEEATWLRGKVHQMMNNWAESSPEKQNELWQSVMQQNHALFAALADIELEAQ